MIWKVILMFHPIYNYIVLLVEFLQFKVENNKVELILTFFKSKNVTKNFLHSFCKNHTNILKENVTTEF